MAPVTASYPPVAASSGADRAALSIPAVLSTLKDVGGITGSFVFTNRGQLFAREIHPMFDDDALSEAAERLTRLHDTFAAAGDHLELAVIRFQDHKLYLKVLDGGMLCILADGVVNMAALRMAANMVCRRIAPDLVLAAAGAVPSPAAVAHTTVVAPAGQTRDSGQYASLEIRGLTPEYGGGGRGGVHATPLPSTPSRPPSVGSPGLRRFRGRTVE